jgi:hypothetical protein
LRRNCAGSRKRARELLSELDHQLWVVLGGFDKQKNLKYNPPRLLHWGEPASVGSRPGIMVRSSMQSIADRVLCMHFFWTTKGVIEHKKPSLQVRMLHNFEGGVVHT